MANKKYIDLYKCREDFYNDILSILSDDITNDRANEIIDVFDSLPTADVQKVKRGYWKFNQHSKVVASFICSECQAGFYNFGSSKILSPTPYCPNCGARMDGDNDA